MKVMYGMTIMLPLNTNFQLSKVESWREAEIQLSRLHFCAYTYEEKVQCDKIRALVKAANEFGAIFVDLIKVEKEVYVIMNFKRKKDLNNFDREKENLAEPFIKY